METISPAKIAEHTRLLNSLSALDYVPTAQEDNNARLEIVRGKVTAKEREVAALVKKTQNEYKDTRKLNSSVRRLMIRIRDGGKDAVVQRVQKEEAEYMEAYRQEREARDELDVLVGERDQREAARVDLVEKEKTIKECKEKIDALYQGLFGGHTPQYPREEEAERRFNQSQTEYTNCQVQLNNETNALTELAKAEKALRICLAKLHEVHTSIAHTPLGDGGSWTEVMVNMQLSSAMVDSTMVNKFMRDAEECVGVGVIGSIGDVKVHTQKYQVKIQGTRYVQVPLPNLPQKIQENIKQLQQCHTRLAGEIDSCHARISDHQSRLKHYARNMQTLRKELAKVRCEIMLGMTDPATIHPQTHRSAANAIEIGDSELPTYDGPSPTEDSSSSPTNLNRAASTSFAVPTYEQAQAQAQPAGGFRVTLEGASSPRNQVPDYAPPGIGPAPGPGGIGGFRGTTSNDEDNMPGRSQLSLMIPEPQVNGRSAGSPSLLAATSLWSPGASPTSPSTPRSRPPSWLNPYAAAMIRRASVTDEEPSPPGAWRGNTNPFAALMSEEPHQHSTR